MGEESSEHFVGDVVVCRDVEKRVGEGISAASKTGYSRGDGGY